MKPHKAHRQDTKLKIAPSALPTTPKPAIPFHTTGEDKRGKKGRKAQDISVVPFLPPPTASSRSPSSSDVAGSSKKKGAPLTVKDAISTTDVFDDPYCTSTMSSDDTPQQDTTNDDNDNDQVSLNVVNYRWKLVAQNTAYTYDARTGEVRGFPKKRHMFTSALLAISEVIILIQYNILLIYMYTLYCMYRH